MKKLSLVLLLSVLVFTACNQELITGRGKITTSNKTLSSFQKLEIIGSCDVEIYNSTESYAEISDYENLLPYLYVEVEGNTLIIKTKDNVGLIGSKAKVKVFIPWNLTSVSISGSGDIDVNGIFPTLAQYSITGSGDIDATVNGAAPQININIAGSGDIELLKINAAKVNCSITGSGDCKLWASETLKVNISGSGDVYYKGTPILNTSITGSGEVIHID
jgi:hypothetical protein